MRCALDLPDASAPQNSGYEAGDGFIGEYKIGTFPRRIITTKNGLEFADQPGAILRLGGMSTLFDANDPENTYHFSELRDGKYQRFEALSPLWPPQHYQRVL